MLYYASKEQYINLRVLLAEYKYSICIIQPFTSQTNIVITYFVNFALQYLTAEWYHIQRMVLYRHL